MTRSVYSELRGTIVDSQLVGRKVARAEGIRPKTVPPYIEIDEESPIGEAVRGHFVTRTFDVRIYQVRGPVIDTALPGNVRRLFDRKTWDYYEDDAQTVRRRVITRTPTTQFFDSPDDGLVYHEVTVVVQVDPDAI